MCMYRKRIFLIQRCSERQQYNKIIKDADNNQMLKSSSNVNRKIILFKDLENHSVHKNWYNYTQKDIEPHILKYRIMTEELLYKLA